MESTQKENAVKKSWIWLISFFVLIMSGIVAKRVFHHPEHMMLYHIPAAVCLAIWGQIITRPIREKNKMLILHKKRFAKKVLEGNAL
jgi:hypothetical protein